MIEIEYLLRELERSKSVVLGDTLSTKLETIEQKLGNLEKLVERFAPDTASVRLGDLMEQIIASRVRSDLESSMQALHLVQSYLDDHPVKHRGVDQGAAVTETELVDVPRPPDVPAHPNDTERIVTVTENGYGLDQMLKHADPGDCREIAGLSKRKRETLYQLLLGKSNREIAEKLGITEKTVKNNLYAIYQILRVKSRSQLIHRLLNPITVDSIPNF